ncbi:conserved phage C-terminal domain-containing protein [Metasolibacillus sp. FSL H7-0170]|uniref:conserved phage C-terminal domain-containing protein n=1 Tax=Metasolibacillus sp. FSL H7-0170 TaxID=2921431 RepID=UPI003158AA96
MNLLINEPPLQVLPSLAKKVGLNEAIFLQQLHFRLLISTTERDGYKWIYKTLAEWNEEFPFWSYDTLKRIVAKLEKDGYIVTTNAYNKLKMDKTKWYRVNYSKTLISSIGQNAPFESAFCPDGKVQNAPMEECNLPSSDEGKMHPAIPKDIKSIKNNNVEQADTVHSVIEYLNVKATKNFNAKSKATTRLINGRLAEGYTLQDFHQVIDIKVRQWLHNPEMNKYLRPATLFSPTNFESYLNEQATSPVTKKPVIHVAGPLDLNFNQGEEF